VEGDQGMAMLGIVPRVGNVEKELSRAILEEKLIA
jgi:hypothetical protein